MIAMLEEMKNGQEEMREGHSDLLNPENIIEEDKVKLQEQDRQEEECARQAAIRIKGNSTSLESYVWGRKMLPDSTDTFNPLLVSRQGAGCKEKSSGLRVAGPGIQIEH